MRRLGRLLAVAAVALVVTELVTGAHGRWPGLSVALGLGGALVLAFGAKALGELGLQRADPDAPSGPESAAEGR